MIWPMVLGRSQLIGEIYRLRAKVQLDMRFKVRGHHIILWKWNSVDVMTVFGVKVFRIN